MTDEEPASMMVQFSIKCYDQLVIDSMTLYGTARIVF